MKKKRKSVPPEEEFIVASPPKAIKGNGVQVNYNDKKMWCPNNKFCGTDHQGPKLHEIRSGWCSEGSDLRTHKRCAGVFFTAGRRKVVFCVCECHLPAPRKLKKLSHHHGG